MVKRLFCTNCGAELREGTRFCTKCGAEVGQVEAIEASVAPDAAAVEEAKAPAAEAPSAVDVAAQDEAVEEDGFEDAAAGVPADETVVLESAPVEAASESEVASAPKVEPEAAESAPAPSRRRRVTRGIAAAAACALLAGAGGVVAWRAGVFDPATVLPFVSQENGAVEASRIVPTAIDGTRLERYFVRLVDGADKRGKDIDVSGYKPVEVTDANGYDPAELFPSLPNGEYTVSYEDGRGNVLGGGTFLVGPAFKKESSKSKDASKGATTGAASGKTTKKDDATASSSAGKTGKTDKDAGASDKDAGKNDKDTGSSATAKKGAKACFLQAIEDLEKKHGAGEAVDWSSSAKAASSDDRMGSEEEFRSALGVCYAELVPFGDGVERLVVAYASKEYAQQFKGGESPVPSDESAYTVEIFEYNKGKDALASVYCEPVTYTNGGYPYISWIRLTDGDDGPRLLEVHPDDPNSSSLVAYLGAAKGGTFGEVVFNQDTDEWAGTTTVSLFEDQWMMGDTMGTEEDFVTNDGHTMRGVTVKDAVKTVADTKKELESNK